MSMIKDKLIYLLSLVKWLLLALVVGFLGGLLGFLFLEVFHAAVWSFEKFPWLLYLLPIAGLLIVFLYRITHRDSDHGTNDMITSVQCGSKISFWIMPLMVVSTALTHLCGGSAGKEGAALQLGGSLGCSTASLLRMDADWQKTMTLCGMAAVFSAVFGTPLTAAIFVLEFISVGIVLSSAFPATLLSSFTAFSTVKLLGMESELYPTLVLPTLDVGLFLRLLLLGLAVGLASVLFCLMLHGSEHFLNLHLKNKYIRILLGGVLIIIFTLAAGNRDLNGSGQAMIFHVLEGGSVLPFFFLFKMLFTSVSISSGYKGGEIVPTLCIGATLGAALGPILGLNPVFAAACGMLGLFCGVTNCVIASILLGAELFGFEGILFFALVCAISYAVSGNHSLYLTQTALFSKSSAKLANVASRIIHKHDL